jgi:hypothetical protein
MIIGVNVDGVMYGYKHPTICDGYPFVHLVYSCVKYTNI